MKKSTVEAFGVVMMNLERAMVEAMRNPDKAQWEALQRLMGAIDKLMRALDAERER